LPEKNPKQRRDCPNNLCTGDSFEVSERPLFALFCSKLWTLRDKCRAVKRCRTAVPGLKEGQPLSNMAMLNLLGRMGHGDITAHGFRSTFRDWAAEQLAMRVIPMERSARQLSLNTEIRDVRWVEDCYGPYNEKNSPPSQPDGWGGVRMPISDVPQ
jgi:hypothetical protein